MNEIKITPNSIVKIESKKSPFDGKVGMVVRQDPCSYKYHVRLGRDIYVIKGGSLRVIEKADYVPEKKDRTKDNISAAIRRGVERMKEKDSNYRRFMEGV